MENPIVWVDLEMTDADINRGHIIEIACIITDGQLSVVQEGPNIVINQPPEIMENMNAWCIKQHGQSGLTQRVLDSRVSLEQAEALVLQFIQQHVKLPKTAPLAGNSIHVDRMFLVKYMPKLEQYLHYRIIDVSSIKELCWRWYPKQYNQKPTKNCTHRALDDIRESIEELRFYRKAIFLQSEHS